MHTGPEHHSAPPWTLFTRFPRIPYLELFSGSTFFHISYSQHFNFIIEYLIVVLICISLIASYIEHLSMCLLSSVQSLSHVRFFATPLQHTKLPCPSPIPGAWSNSCPLNRSCHPTILSSVILFSSCLQSFPASGFFPVSSSYH